MKIQDVIFKNNEKISDLLRSLYARNGYSHFKMSQFEEYDLYVRNKDFLISDSIITFTDTNGKLMALKPDVTFSILKNSKFAPGCVQRYYYNENVYRVSKDTQAFKEIMQTGLECIGDIDRYSIFEVLTLAAKSLQTISDSCVLTVSFLDFIYEILDSISVSVDEKNAMLKCMGEKNIHELSRMCAESGVDAMRTNALCQLASCYGKPETVLPQLEKLLKGLVREETLENFQNLMEILASAQWSQILRIDFSVISDMKYYNGIVFKGFVEGVPVSVLSGGQYDRLMEKMGHKSRAIGFAVYLDSLRRQNMPKNYDADVALLYNEGVSADGLYRAAEALREEGMTVQLQRALPPKAKYRKILQFQNGEVTAVEADA
mgnify:CR=1 FL=1